MNDLDLEFIRLRKNHRRAIRERAARSALGPSVIRVFAPGTRRAVLPYLAGLDVDGLSRLKTCDQFERWYEKNLASLARIVGRLNRRNARIRPGVKWGHSAKVLSLYLRGLVYHSRYFSDPVADRIGPWLFVPVDRIVLDRLRDLGINLPFRRIRDIATRQDFYLIQRRFDKSCQRVAIPRVWFDDNWAVRLPRSSVA
jgi:hypothetical protein